MFAYNFPHPKTQDVLLALTVAGYRIEAVLAADHVDLKIPTSDVRTSVRRSWRLHPTDLAAGLGLRYEVVPHAGEKIEALLDEVQPDLGVVAGARLLGQPVIDLCGKGILNMHPGLIPRVRGLDSLLWAIREDVPLGVTAHLIDERVDAGRIVMSQEIEVLPDDHIFDLSERLYETELIMLPAAVQLALDGHGEAVGDPGPSKRKMPEEMEHATMEMVSDFVQRHSRRP